MDQKLLRPRSINNVSLDKVDKLFNNLRIKTSSFDGNDISLTVSLFHEVLNIVKWKLCVMCLNLKTKT
jgi:hypothetical protein